MAVVVTIFIVIAIIGVFAGTFMWANIFQTGEIVQAVGCFVLIFSLFVLILTAVLQQAADEVDGKSTIKKVLFYSFATISAILLTGTIFCFFNYVHLVPGMPHNE